MNLGYIIALYLVEAVLIIGILYIFFKKTKKEDDLKIEKLRLKIKKYKEKLDLKEVEINDLTSNIHETNFISSEVKKRELLEDKIEKLYRIIEDTKDIAKDATMMKSDFLSNIRHEVRTPLNSIVVFAQMLSKEITDKRLRGYASDIFSAGGKLLILLDNVIELSKIKSDSIKIEEKAVDIYELIHKSIDIFKRDAIHKGLDINVEIDEEMPKILMLDKGRVRDIFNNLLSNAIHFTQKGHINVFVKVDESNIVNNLINLSISVEDTGIGICEANQKKIFEIFETTDCRDDVQYQGRGIELSVNKKLAQLMNGDLEVKSDLSEGSTFTLSLKDIEVVLSSEDGDSEVDFSLIKSTDITIMVVDTQKENYELIKDSFLNTSANVLGFDNSRDAIELLKKQKVDLIFIDVEIFTGDEGAVSKVIKTVSKAFVVTLTDKRMKNIVFSDAGVQPLGHLKKPISKVELFKITIKVLNTREEFLTKKNITEIEKKYNFIDDIDIEDLKVFLKAQDVILTKLYQEAVSTNDLKVIKVFSTSLLDLSLKYRNKNMIKYSKNLLQKVESFEIDEINSLLQSYKVRIEEFENYIKDR